jgi:hypothetical protein
VAREGSICRVKVGSQLKMLSKAGTVGEGGGHVGGGRRSARQWVTSSCLNAHAQQRMAGLLGFCWEDGSGLSTVGGGGWWGAHSAWEYVIGENGSCATQTRANKRQGITFGWWGGRSNGVGVFRWPWRSPLRGSPVGMVEVHLVVRWMSQTIPIPM